MNGWIAPSSPASLALRVGVLAAFCIVAYLPSLGVPFVFDDIPNIALNSRVQPNSWAELPQAIDARRGVQDRPVAMVSFAMNFLHARLDPTPYHVVNIAVHILATVCLFALLHALTAAPRSPHRLRENRVPFAFTGALLWAVHPVNTQAVTYIVQRMASMAAAFYLVALLLFVLWRLGRLRGRYALPGVVCAGLLAFGSKEHAVTLPVALLLVDIVFFAGFRRYHVFAIAATGVLAGVVAAVYAPSILEHLFATAPRRDFSGWERLLTQGRVIWHYLSLLAWPDASRLQLDYDIEISRSLTSPVTTAIAWAGIAALTALAVRGWRDHPWPSFGWLFFLVALSVESTVLPLELVFEHRLYLPASLLIPAMLAPLYTRVYPARMQAALGLAAVVVAGLLTWQTVERNTVWADSARFWHKDRERGASVDRASLNAAVEELRHGHPGKALHTLEGVGETSNIATQSKIEEVRGEATFMLGEFESALDHFRAVLEMRPRWERPAFYAGEALLALDRPRLAQSMLVQMKQYDPDSVYTVTLAASIDAETRDPASAAARLEDYLQRGASLREADRAFVRMRLANLYQVMERPKDAVEQYREVVRYSPNNWAAWSAIYWMLRAGGDSGQAARVREYLEHQGVDPSPWRGAFTAASIGRRMKEPGGDDERAE